MHRHTAGPWHSHSRCIGDTIVLDGVVRIHDAAGYQVAAVCCDEYQEANARLIAAAPDMLAALELAEATLLRLTEGHAGRRGSIRGTLDVVRAAVAKAEED